MRTSCFNKALSIRNESPGRPWKKTSRTQLMTPLLQSVGGKYRDASQQREQKDWSRIRERWVEPNLKTFPQSECDIMLRSRVCLEKSPNVSVWLSWRVPQGKSAERLGTLQFKAPLRRTWLSSPESARKQLVKVFCSCKCHPAVLIVNGKFCCHRLPISQLTSGAPLQAICPRGTSPADIKMPKKMMHTSPERNKHDGCFGDSKHYWIILTDRQMDQWTRQ